MIRVAILFLVVEFIVLIFLICTTKDLKKINALKEENKAETEKLKKREAYYEDCIKRQKVKSGEKISELLNEKKSLEFEIKDLKEELNSLEKEKIDAESYATSVGNMMLNSYKEHKQVLQVYNNVQHLLEVEE